MEGRRHSVVGADGVTIGLLTAGSGSPLLLVHGGMGRLEAWSGLWGTLSEHWRVTAMDRRGRGSSGDAEPYELGQEYDDVAAVAAHLAEDHGPVGVFGHSYGATAALGAAARSSAIGRLALYEPPGPQTVPREWVDRAKKMVADGQAGRAMVGFLREIIGLTIEQIEVLRDARREYDVRPIVAATLPREAEALTSVDLLMEARSVTCHVLLLVGAKSPPWAADITRALAATLVAGEVVVLAGQGHDAIDSAPDVVVRELLRFFGHGLVTPADGYP